MNFIQIESKIFFRGFKIIKDLVSINVFGNYDKKIRGLFRFLQTARRQRYAKPGLSRLLGGKTKPFKIKTSLAQHNNILSQLEVN